MPNKQLEHSILNDHEGHTWIVIKYLWFIFMLKLHYMPYKNPVVIIALSLSRLKSVDNLSHPLEYLPYNRKYAISYQRNYFIFYISYFIKIVSNLVIENMLYLIIERCIFQNYYFSNIFFQGPYFWLYSFYVKVHTQNVNSNPTCMFQI